MLKDLFNNKTEYATVNASGEDDIIEKPNIPSGMWLKCDKCGSIIYKEDLRANQYVCT